jgi:hypothetical protein
MLGRPDAPGSLWMAARLPGERLFRAGCCQVVVIRPYQPMRAIKIRVSDLAPDQVCEFTT